MSQHTAQLLNEAESAKFAAVSRETIAQYIEFGLIKPASKNGQGFLFDRNDLAHTFHILEEINPNSFSTNKINSPVTDNLPKQALAGEIEISNTEGAETNNLPAVRDVELIQLNRQLRDQLRTLSSERDWLKERLEKLEERSEREQMLLLSTSQTMRDLIQNKKPENSGFLSFLNWFKN
jgi:DNA-binding transcriptional MerR regulator